MKTSKRERKTFKGEDKVCVLRGSKEEIEIVFYLVSRTTKRAHKEKCSKSLTASL